MNAIEAENRLRDIAGLEPRKSDESALCSEIMQYVSEINAINVAKEKFQDCSCSYIETLTDAKVLSKSIHDGTFQSEEDRERDEEQRTRIIAGLNGTSGDDPFLTAHDAVKILLDNMLVSLDATINRSKSDTQGEDER